MENKNASGGVAFGSLLLLTFIILKLTKVIDWSWWWVLSPLWIGFLIMVIIAILVVIVYANSKD